MVCCPNRHLYNIALMVTKLVIQELMMSEEESQVPIWSYGLWKQAIQDLLIATVQTSEN